MVARSVPRVRPAARLPLGPPDGVRRPARRPIPTASSTSRSARRSTPPPTSPGGVGRGGGRSRIPAHDRSSPRPGRLPSTGCAVAWACRRRARRRAAGHRVQGADRRACRGHLGVGPGDLVVFPELAYPTYDVGARLAGADVHATDSLTAVGPRTPASGLRQLPGQPHRADAPRRAPAQDGRLVSRAREPARQRRVLRRVRLGRASPSRCCTPTSAAARPRAPGHPLAVEALQPGGLPLRLRRRGPAWSASCWPSARTSACRCRRRSRR